MNKFFSFISKLITFFLAITSIFVGISFFFKQKKLKISELLSKKHTTKEE